MSPTRVVPVDVPATSNGSAEVGGGAISGAAARRVVPGGDAPGAHGINASFSAALNTLNAGQTTEPVSAAGAIDEAIAAGGDDEKRASGEEDEGEGSGEAPQIVRKPTFKGLANKVKTVNRIRAQAKIVLPFDRHAGIETVFDTEKDAAIDVAAAEARPERAGYVARMIRLRTFYEQLNVQLAVAGLIFLSFVVNMAEAQWMGPASSASYGLEPEAKAGLRRTFLAFELFFTGAFTVELALNMLSRSAHEFWCSGWNLFDFFIVFSSLFDCLGIYEGPGVAMFRIFRAFRVFRLFKRIASLRQIVQALEQAIPGVSHAFSILVLVLSIYAILGVSFFGEPCPELYGTFGAAFLTNFQVMTGDSWMVDIGRPVIAATHWTAAFYFITEYLVAAMVLVNVMIAVLLDKFVTDGEEGGIEEAQLDAIITKLRQDKTRATNIAVDALPPEVREPVYSNAFYVRCLERFKLADWSCNGTLSPDEIIDIFRDMVPERLRQAVQLTHAEQLVEIFDDDKDGQLTREEFYRFCQLTVLAAHIAEQEKKMCTVDPASETAKKVSEVAAHVRSVDVRLGSLAKIEAKVDRLLEAQLALCARVGGLEERQAVTEEALPARHRLRLDSIGSEQSNDTTRDLPSTSKNPNERG